MTNFTVIMDSYTMCSEIVQILWYDSLHPSQQFFSHVVKGLPRLNQY